MPRRNPITAAAIYCRLSQDRSGESLGIERQRELCEKLAAERGWQVARTYEERNVSAFNGAVRPAFRKLVAAIESGTVDAVLAVDQDRLARRLGELNNLLELCAEHRVPIVLLSGEIDTTSADGMLRAQILGAVAQNESAKKSERLKRQRDQAAKSGKFQGGTRRYGYEADGVTLRKAEAKIVLQVADRILAGESLRSIVLDLNERGIPAAKGGLWRVTQLRDLMRSPRLAGLRVHHGEIVGDAAWKPILDRATHERLCIALGQRRTGRGRPPTSLLGGIARCARCGGKMNQTRQQDRRIYRCSTGASSDACSGVLIAADPLDEIITAAVVHRLDSKAFARALDRQAKRTTQHADGDDLAVIDADLEALAADHGAGRISRREWMAAREGLDQRRAAALAAIERETNDESAALLRSPDLATTWPTLPVERRRAVLGALIETVTVGPTLRHGSNTFDPDRVDIVWRA